MFHYNEKDRNEEIASTVAANIPPITPVPTAFARQNRHHDW